MRHITRCLIAGIVAILPIGGTIATLVWLESSIREVLFASSRFYFPGLGLIAVVFALYGVGLLVTTFLGRWLFRAIDRLMARVPLLGMAYRSLKQVLGYGSGKDALFQRVVWVPNGDTEGAELGLVTRGVNETAGAAELVFVPGSPNPMAGRLVLIDCKDLRSAGIEVNAALELLVTMGKANHRIHIGPRGEIA
jgi:uncharacterized membrane protein